MACRALFYLPPAFQLIDFAGPLDAFATANQMSARRLYEWQITSRRGGAVKAGTGVSIATSAPSRGPIDTLVIVGGAIDCLRQAEEVEAVRSLALRASRIASVCTGAFLLGDAGLRGGRRATTHWSCARQLQTAQPDVQVDVDRIFIADGPIWTSAGVTAGIDLALAMIEADHGTALAREVSQEMVVYHRRPGSQSQFSALSQSEPETDRTRRAIAFAREHMSERLSVADLAHAASLSPRQFARVFRQETGETPAKAIERLRLEAAVLRLEEGREAISVIAKAVGFGDQERMRRAFIARYGHPPSAMRRASPTRV